MANVFIALPVPAADGVGAWVDVSAQGPEKTVSVDGGAFGGDILLEGSNDAQASAAPAIVGPFPGPTFKPQTFIQAFNFMRVRRRNSGGAGTPTVTLAAPAAIASVFGAMNVPAGDGVGTAIDISGGGDINTFQVVGPFTDQIFIETSTDGVNFSPTLIFDNGGAVGQQVIGVLSAARVRRRVRGTLAGVSPLISVGSQATSGAAGGAFPGFGAAPPSIAATSAAGAAATASRSDHTHRGALESGSYTAPAALQSAGLLSQTFGGGIGTLGITALVAGANITITPGAGTLTIAASGGGGGVATVTAGTGITLTGTGTDPVVNANLSTGVAGGQSAIGGTLTTQNLTLRPNAADTTTGRAIVQGLGVQLPVGSIALPSVSFGTANTGIYSGAANEIDISIGGLNTYLFQAGGNFEVNGGASAGIQVANVAGTAVTGFFGHNLANTGVTIGSATSNAAITAAAVRFDALFAGGTRFPNVTYLSYTSSSTALVPAGAGTVCEYQITPATQAAAANTRLDAYMWDAVTATFTGGTNITTALGVNLITINAPIYTNASAMSITNAATLAITGPPVSGGSLVLGALAVSLWVQSGSSRFDGTVLTSQVNPIAGTLTLQDSGATSIWTLSNTSALLLAPTIRIGGTSGSTAGDTFLTPATGGAGSAVTIFGTVAQFLKIAIPINLSTGNVTPNNVTAASLGATGPTGMSSLPVEYAILSTPGGNRAFPLFSMP